MSTPTRGHGRRPPPYRKHGLRHGAETIDESWRQLFRGTSHITIAEALAGFAESVLARAVELDLLTEEEIVATQRLIIGLDGHDIAAACRLWQRYYAVTDRCGVGKRRLNLARICRAIAGEPALTAASGLDQTQATDLCNRVFQTTYLAGSLLQYRHVNAHQQAPIENFGLDVHLAGCVLRLVEILPTRIARRIGDARLAELRKSARAVLRLALARDPDGEAPPPPPPPNPFDERHGFEAAILARLDGLEAQLSSLVAASNPMPARARRAASNTPTPLHEPPSLASTMPPLSREAARQHLLRLRKDLLAKLEIDPAPNATPPLLLEPACIERLLDAHPTTLDGVLDALTDEPELAQLVEHHQSGLMHQLRLVGPALDAILQRIAAAPDR